MGSPPPHAMAKSRSSPSLIHSGNITLGPAGPPTASAADFGYLQIRSRGRPFCDGLPAAGAPSGGPTKRSYLTKFEALPGRVPYSLDSTKYSVKHVGWCTTTTASLVP